MPLRCPNCGLSWTVEATTCAHCGATFISGRAWRRERAQAERDAVLQSLSGLALLAALGGWLGALLPALAASWRDAGSLALVRAYLGVALKGGVTFWLAVAAVALGAAALGVARSRGVWHWGWVGLGLGVVLAGLRWVV